MKNVMTQSEIKESTKDGILFRFDFMPKGTYRFMKTLRKTKCDDKMRDLLVKLVKEDYSKVLEEVIDGKEWWGNAHLTK